MKIGDLVLRVGYDSTHQKTQPNIGIIIKMEEQPRGRGGPEATVYWARYGLYYNGYKLSELVLYEYQ